MGKGDLARESCDEVPRRCHHHVKKADDHHMKPVLGEKKGREDGQNDKKDWSPESPKVCRLFSVMHFPLASNSF
jgi:hypothetical protein